MRKIISFIIFFICLHNVFAQTIRDTVFNSVWLINKTDITTDGQSFLIDLDIRSQEDVLILFIDDSRIPPDLFFDKSTFLADQKEIILITPDVHFYNEIQKKENENGMHIRAFPRNKFYHIQRNSDGYTVDSASVQMVGSTYSVQLNFIRPNIQEENVNFYYELRFGSICCPRDTKWSLTDKYAKIISTFEQVNNVNISENTHRFGFGKEGEHKLLYSLIGLSNLQKLDFIKQMNEVSNSNTPKLIVPFIHKE